jgi:hypothetical protein
VTEPYETQRQAADAARHIYDSQPGSWGDGNLRLLEDACRAAGVQLGAYDHRILVWLTGWEPATCAVIAGLITRAHASRAATGQMAEIRAVLAAFDWEFDDRQLALEAIERIVTRGES